jgi:putative phosphoesterase
MKLLICSDIHGDIEGARAAVRFFEEHKCDHLLILGDILYHGPRNDLPDAYAPKAVIELLNKYADKIISVKGNCEAEVDGMVLDFPTDTDHVILHDGETYIYASHGHHHNIATPPRLPRGAVLLHGHTHVQASVEFGNDNLYLNPGSVSLPKEGNPKTLMIYENSTFTLYDLDGNVMWVTNS